MTYHERQAKGSRRKQARILGYIRSYILASGYPPSLREITDACHFSSTSVAAYNLDRLVEQGRIERDPDIARGIRLVEKKEDLA